jgi:hypothetical protein
VPTSVLLAVLAAAGLLALAPALVRRYDATERLAAERASSTARVLQRRRRPRTVPGRRPINPGRAVTVTVPAPPDQIPDKPQRRLRVVTGRRPVRRPPPRRHATAVIRRRRVLAALLLLNVSELVGVLAVGPGFWIGFAVTAMLLALYLVHLRNRAIADRRRRRIEAREAAWLAARQAEVRREQARRAAAWGPDTTKTPG